MITALKIIFSALLVFMTIIVVSTSLESSLFEEWDFLAGIPWMRATLWDFYANVLVIYCWVLYKERNWLFKLIWLVLLVTLGSIGSCLYVLVALFRLPGNATVKDLLTQQQ
jgi:uncharacterized membrane protein YczE